MQVQCGLRPSLFGRVVGFCLVAVAVAAATPTEARQQPAAASAEPPANGLILGRVVDAVSNRPIPDAIVSLSDGQMLMRDLNAVGLPQPPPTRRVVADSEGRFVLRNLPPGPYRLNTSAAGYLSGQYGQLRPQSAAQPFVLAPDQKAGNVTIRLWKASTISGRVVDEAGDPVVGVRVDLLRQSRSDGKWLPNAYASGRTDDRGMYRITGNLPSLYYVVVPSTISSIPESVTGAAIVESAVVTSGALENLQAGLSMVRTGRGASMRAGDAWLLLTSPNAFSLPPRVTDDGSVFGYATTFYPNSLTSARATPITLAAGEDRTDVNIELRPVPLVRVSGNVMGPSGPEKNLTVFLVSSEDEAVGNGASLDALTNGEGQFSFVAVPPGQFMIKTTRIGPEGAQQPTLWAELPIAITDRSLSGVALRLQEGIAVSGRVVFEGAGLASDQQVRQIVAQAQAFRFSLSPADGRSAPCCPPATANTAGDFRTQGYVPGRYYPTVPNVPGWYLKSVTARGRDIMRSPLVVGDERIDDVLVTYTQKESSIQGRVTASGGTIDPDATILIFPLEYEAMAAGVNLPVVRLSRPTPQTGAFSLPNILPGDYFIAAVPDADLPNWRDMAALRALSQFAVRITVAPGERKVVNLTRGDLR
jgi:protocatechuate 3,4-dioxygenase beta subunit